MNFEYLGAASLKYLECDTMLKMIELSFEQKEIVRRCRRIQLTYSPQIVARANDAVREFRNAMELPKMLVKKMIK